MSESWDDVVGPPPDCLQPEYPTVQFCKMQLLELLSVHLLPGLAQMTITYVFGHFYTLGDLTNFWTPAQRAADWEWDRYRIREDEARRRFYSVY